MNTVLILFIIISIGYTVLWIFGKVFRRKKQPIQPIKPKEPINPYILYHKMKLKNDMDYDEYLKFCGEVGEAPMDKQGFDDLNEPEKEVKKLLK